MPSDERPAMTDERLAEIRDRVRDFRGALAGSTVHTFAHDDVPALLAELDRLRAREAALVETMEKLADVAQFVLDRIANGVTNDERYVMKDASRIAMDSYRALASQPAATAPETEKGDDGE